MTARSVGVVLALGATLATAPPASGAESSIGVGLALSSDLPDPVSGDYARFGPGPSLQIPVRVGLAPAANVRATVRADLGTGSDRVTWEQSAGGETHRFYDDDHFAALVAAGATVGPELVFPTSGAVKPTLGAEVGVAWVGTYHALSGPTAILVDPSQNDVNSEGNIDPYSSQAVFLTDVHGGILTEGTVGFFAELGYSMAYLGASELKKTPPALKAQREAYGWNAARVGVGVLFAL